MDHRLSLFRCDGCGETYMGRRTGSVRVLGCSEVGAGCAARVGESMCAACRAATDVEISTPATAPPRAQPSAPKRHICSPTHLGGRSVSHGISRLTRLRGESRGRGGPDSRPGWCAGPRSVGSRSTARDDLPPAMSYRPAMTDPPAIGYSVGGRRKTDVSPSSGSPFSWAPPSWATSSEPVDAEGESSIDRKSRSPSIFGAGPSTRGMRWVGRSHR